MACAPGFARVKLSDSRARSLCRYLVDPFIHQWRGYDDPANLQDNDHQLIFEDTDGSSSNGEAFAVRTLSRS